MPGLVGDMALDLCPHCGAELPRRAKACPACGSDKETGWSDSAAAYNLGLPDGEFNYDDFVKEEFGTHEVKPRGIRWLWWLVAVCLIGLFLYSFLR
jgi:hypothetical protein